jgi:hypothetical protein
VWEFKNLEMLSVCNHHEEEECFSYYSANKLLEMSGQFFHQGLKDTFQTVLERINTMHHSKHAIAPRLFRNKKGYCMPAANSFTKPNSS